MDEYGDYIDEFVEGIQPLIFPYEDLMAIIGANSVKGFYGIDLADPSGISCTSFSCYSGLSSYYNLSGVSDYKITGYYTPSSVNFDMSFTPIAPANYINTTFIISGGSPCLNTDFT